MRRWLALVGIGCLVAFGCSESDDQAEPTEETADEAVRDDDVQLACALLDDSGWSRADLPSDSIGLPVSMAANDEHVVLVGSGSEGAIAAHVSSGGLSWGQIEDFPNWQSLGHSVAGNATGFVAVGTRNGAMPSTPVVAFSADGTTWDELDPESLPADDVRAFSEVFAGPEGFIILGGSSSPPGLLSWHSSDGSTWVETDLPQTARTAAVAATDSGWVALTEPPMEVWASSDGIAWTEVETRSTPPDHALWPRWAHIGTAPLQVQDDAWVLALVGAPDDAPWPHYPTVWVSTDGGASWNEHAVWNGSEANGFEVEDMVATELGLILVGQQDLTGRAENYLHSSDDGTSWQHCWTGPLAFTELVAFGGGIVAFDSEFGDVLVWNEP